MNTYKKYKAESELGERLARTIEFMITDIDQRSWEKYIKNAINDYWRGILELERND